VDPETRRAVDVIREDRVHGASWLARRALEVAGDAAALSPGASVGEVAAAVETAARMLIESRPGMAPIRNWLDRLLARLAELAPRAGDVESFRRAVRREAGELARQAGAAGSLAASRAAETMAPGERVFTASHSATVDEACRLAWRSGRLRQVFAAQSRSPDGRTYGEEVREALAPAGISVTVVPDAGLAEWVRRASLVLVGADSVLRDGSVLNGTPTLALARAAREAGVPVRVVCEAAKRDRWTDAASLGSSGLETGFDLVPADLVDAVITEEGLVAATSAG